MTLQLHICLIRLREEVRFTILNTNSVKEFAEKLYLR